MIFKDSNVPLHLVGAEHPNKKRSVDVLQELFRSEERFVTSVEVYREMLHRYTAIQRPDVIDSAFHALSALVDEILGFGMVEIHKARTIIDSVVGLTARDALHTAVMESAGVTKIFTFDRGFDACPGIERLY